MKCEDLFGLAIRLFAAWLVLSNLPCLLVAAFEPSPKLPPTASLLSYTVWYSLAKLVVGMFVLRFAGAITRYTFPPH